MKGFTRGRGSAAEASVLCVADLEIRWAARDMRHILEHWHAQQCRAISPIWLTEQSHPAQTRMNLGPLQCKGAFSHSAHTAPIITVIIQVTTLKTTHLRNHAQSIQNSKIQTSDACHGSQGPKFCPL